MSLLTVTDLNVSYDSSPAVQGVNLEVEPGQMTAIVGESGSGKSTSALAILGLLPDNAAVDAGSVTFQGRDLTGLSRKQWRGIRGEHIGLVPQDPNNSLNPLKTIGAAVEEGMEIHGRGDRRARALELLERVGIDDPERRYHQYPHELSGGMKQRVLIAAAVALEPELIIADEPTSALDVTVQKTILDLLDDMREELGLGLLFITHDLAVAGDRADQIVVMEAGQVRESGLAATVLTDPQHPYSKRLLADAPSLTAADFTRQQVTSVAAGTQPLLRVDGLVQRFGDFTAVDGVSFEVAKGTTHALVGESGSGKTTTGRSVSMFNQPTAGSIRLDGTELTELDAAGRREARRQVQLVYQNPYSSLDPRRTIADTIAEPLVNFRGMKRARAREAAREFMELVALDPDMGQRLPARLSGGQRQRVAIARAMIIEPELVVLDEAVSALDVTVQSQILRLLDDLQQELGLTYIFISHDLAVVNQVSDTVSVLGAGRQVEYGPTSEAFINPQADLTRRLIEAIPGSRYRGGDLNLGL